MLFVQMLLQDLFHFPCYHFLLLVRNLPFALLLLFRSQNKLFRHFVYHQLAMNYTLYIFEFLMFPFFFPLVFFIFFRRRIIECKYFFPNKFFYVIGHQSRRCIWLCDRPNQFYNFCNFDILFITKYLACARYLRKSYYDSATTGKMQNFPYLLQLFQ